MFRSIWHNFFLLGPFFLAKLYEFIWHVLSSIVGLKCFDSLPWLISIQAFQFLEHFKIFILFLNIVYPCLSWEFINKCDAVEMTPTKCKSIRPHISKWMRWSMSFVLFLLEGNASLVFFRVSQPVHARQYADPAFRQPAGTDRGTPARHQTRHGCLHRQGLRYVSLSNPS